MPAAQKQAEAKDKEEAKETSTGTARAETSELFKLTVAIDSGTFAYPFWVAENKGIFDKYNIEPEFQTYAYGIDTVNAVILDQADMGEAMDFAAISRLGGESQLQFISFTAGNKMDGFVYMPLKTELKSRKI